MCEPVTLALMAAGTAMSAYGQYQQGQSAQDAAKYNAKMSEYAAQDAQRRGEEEAVAIQRKAASLKSSQRVSLASRGLDIGYGTAGDLQDQTDFFGQMDASTARYNAANQAWSARAQGTLAKAEGRAAAYQGALGATGTLLSGAGQVASKWTPSSAAGSSAGAPKNALGKNSNWYLNGYGG